MNAPPLLPPPPSRLEIIVVTMVTVAVVLLLILIQLVIMAMATFYTLRTAAFYTVCVLCALGGLYFFYTLCVSISRRVGWRLRRGRRVPE